MALTKETSFTQIHVIALQAAVAMPRRDFITAITGYVHVQQVTVTSHKHVHLQQEINTAYLSIIS